MTPPLPPDPVLAAATRLLDCLCATLAAYGAPVCRCALVPGAAVAMDACCACAGGEGQAWVRVVTVYPTVQFPNPAQVRAADSDTVTMAAVLEMGVFRCAHGMDNNGNPPTADQVTSDAVEASRDALLMRRAARCCFGDDGGGSDDDTAAPEALIGAWQPIGPSGECHGGAMTVTALVYDCVC